MLTEFGKMLRKIRIDNNELLKNMADRLSVTPSYLSAVEVGKRNIPDNWVNLIALSYGLDNTQRQLLQKSAYDSSNQIKFDLQSMDSTNKNLVLSFAREFKSLDDKQRDKIFSILNKK